MKSLTNLFLKGLYPVARDQLAQHGYLSPQLLETLLNEPTSATKPVARTSNSSHRVLPLANAGVCCG